MKIQTSSDWAVVHVELTKQLNSIRYNTDLRKTLKNINDMVQELSKAEVDARRTKKDYNLKPHLDKINASIDTLEKFILLGMLMY